MDRIDKLNARIEALQLAVVFGTPKSPTETVEAAKAYYGFLTDTGTQENGETS